MEFSNLRFDQAKLMKMWAESRREIEDEEQVEHYQRDAREDTRRHDEDDLEQEVKFLKEKIKHQKYREEDMEDAIGDLEYKNEKLEKEIYHLEKEYRAVQVSLDKKEEIEKELEVLELKIVDILKNNETLNDENKRIKTELLEVKQHTEQSLKENTTENEKVKIEIDSLSKENLSLNEKVKKFTQEEKQVQVLRDEINVLQIGINEKETVLGKINNENEILEEKLLFLDEKNKELEETIHLNALKLQDDCDSIGVELHNSNQDLFKSFKCDSCEKGYDRNSDLRTHVWNKHEKQTRLQQLNNRLLNLHQKISEQKFRFTTSLFSLKEKEEKAKHTCRCKLLCRIYHTKHNWSKSVSDDIFKKFQLMSNGVKNVSTNSTEVITRSYSCDFCEEIFSRESHLKSHIEDIHTVLSIGANDEAGSSLEAEDFNIAQSTKEVVQDNGTKPKQYSCEMCNSTFVRQCDQEKHIRKEHDHKRHQSPHVLIKNLCGVCLMVFGNETELKQHTVKHSANLKVQSKSILKK